MFTGLVTDVGTIEEVSDGAALKRVRVRCGYSPESIAVGASIACGGPCLTATAIEARPNGSAFSVDVGAETLARTTAGRWRKGTRVNLERSVRLGDEMGGHIVTGHIDGAADLLEVQPFDGMSRFVLRTSKPLLRFIAEKGSVCLDGTSLTVNDVGDHSFTVLLVPHTLAVTTWRDRKPGDQLNLEVDLMARYAARFLATAPGQ